MPICTVCSGNQFECYSGFFFCAECQTQSQDVREELHENDDSEFEGQTIGGKRKRGPKSTEVVASSDQENMTSWEGFNFALVGMVDQLIHLGANPSLKLTVLKLWTKYLKKMEVAFFSKECSAFPKLGPNFKKYDANIIYGYSIPKRQCKKDVAASGDNAEEPDNDFDAENAQTPSNSKVQRQTALKLKRKAITQNYEKTMKEMSLASQSLTDVTLDMLNVSEVDDYEGPKELQFNKEGMTKQHIQGSFEFHPGILVRNKLICLLYLGLQESNEDIKLSDLLRWISEGHVSYSRLSTFFPPEANMQDENYVFFAADQPRPSYKVILYASQNLAAYIGVKSLKVPSMKRLIQLYTKELNLPAQICLLAVRLLDVMPPSPDYTSTSVRSAMPNWEGRAMAHIIIALKLLFGLDDATEHCNSRIAKKINEKILSQGENRKLFVWDDWQCFNTLRQTAFSIFHQPSFLKNKLTTSMIQNVQPFFSEWQKSSHRMPSKITKRAAVAFDTFKYITSLFVAKDHSLRHNLDQEDNHFLSFPASLSPYSSYIKVISKSFQEGKMKVSSSDWSHIVCGLNLDMLKENFKDTSIDYLTHPKEYIEWAQQHGLDIGLHSGSAINSIKLIKEAPKNPERFPHFRVKVYLDQIESMPSGNLLSSCQEGTVQPHRHRFHKPLILPKVQKEIIQYCLPKVKDMEVCSDEDNSTNCPEQLFKRGRGRPKMKRESLIQRGRGRPKIERKSLDAINKEDEEKMLYIPHTEYWMLHLPLRMEADFNNDAWRLPQSFKQLLEECASLIEMRPGTLYKEVMFLEVLHKDLLSNFLATDDQLTPKTAMTNLEAGLENRTKSFKQAW